jgi:hypothetical protein
LNQVGKGVFPSEKRHHLLKKLAFVKKEVAFKTYNNIYDNASSAKIKDF